MEKLEHLCKQETDIELTLLGNSPLSESDLIPSTRTLSSLGSLYRSVVRCSPAIMIHPKAET